MPTADDTADQPVLVLPEQAALDPESAGALALMDVLPEMLGDVGADGTVVALDVRRIARTVLDAVADMPRIPRWDGPRIIGGTTRPPGHPDPEIMVEVRGGLVCFHIETETTAGDPIDRDASIAPADARQWALAVLAACVVAEHQPR